MSAWISAYAESRPSLSATISGRALPLPGLPAPLREGRELAPAAGGQGFVLCPGLPAPLREGRELAPAAVGRASLSA
ncbi:hypothetical protein [Paenibacillus illinoisensis]|uniref:hypothetical protein n=1 Tax=Paenibacillus illinoisensis TaxID=59845 RepID=UPI00301E4E57